VLAAGGGAFGPDAFEAGAFAAASFGAASLDADAFAAAIFAGDAASGGGAVFEAPEAVAEVGFSGPAAAAGSTGSAAISVNSSSPHSTPNVRDHMDFQALFISGSEGSKERTLLSPDHYRRPRRLLSLRPRKDTKARLGCAP
jgi:hypothetical protein